MYTFKEIHQKVDSKLESLGYLWIRDELLYNEIPVIYWSDNNLCLKIQVVERENAVYFDVAKLPGTLPPSDEERWVSLFTFSDEYKKRLLLPLDELVKLVPQKIIGCSEQIDASMKELPTLLMRASTEINGENHGVRPFT